VLCYIGKKLHYTYSHFLCQHLSIQHKNKKMISGKIIMKSSTKLTLDERFSEIAKQAPAPTQRIQQRANVIIPQSRQDLFPNKRPVALSIAQRLKKRSINYRRGGGGGYQAYAAPAKPPVFQRISFSNRRRGGGGNNTGANSYLFGGQSGMGIRLRGQGRVGGPRTFRPRTRGYLNNNQISRFTRGNRYRTNNNNNNNRGRRNNNNNNFNRQNRGRGRGNFNRGRGRGRGQNNNNRNVSKESLDTDLDKYMAHTKIENDAVEMNAV
jgi:hypothetical protein